MLIQVFFILKIFFKTSRSVTLVLGLTACLALTLLEKEVKAAERLDIQFEEMIIPISIEELEGWAEKKGEMSSELSTWIDFLGFENKYSFSSFLQIPIFKESGISLELIRSWAGKELLEQISESVFINEDNSGVILFNTIEGLLEEKETITIIDILKKMPSENILLDLDGVIKIITSWKEELKKQQDLLFSLSNLESSKITFSENNKNLSFSMKLFKLPAIHRNDSLTIELWKPIAAMDETKNLIIFMPGLGGDRLHFRWLAKNLSERGWPVALIQHQGSDSESIKALVKGGESLPGGAEVFLYRLKDLEIVIKAFKEGELHLNNENFVIMGHSLGSLISYFYSGALPQEGLASRCDNALKDLSLTNLSILMQCHVDQIYIPKNKDTSNLTAIIGINSFGSILWPNKISRSESLPVLLTGGTFDLITPVISEQLQLFLSTKPNTFSRVLIIEGASHFSPVRVLNDQNIDSGEDIFKINNKLIGADPNDVQALLSKIIIEFLISIEKKEPLDLAIKQKENDLKFYLLNRDKVNLISK